MNLNHARLPIPPLRHILYYNPKPLGGIGDLIYGSSHSRFELAFLYKNLTFSQLFTEFLAHLTLVRIRLLHFGLDIESTPKQSPTSTYLYYNPKPFARIGYFININLLQTQFYYKIKKI